MESKIKNKSEFVKTRVTGGQSRIGGVRVDAVDYKNVMDRVRVWVTKRTEPVPYVVQANALSIVSANEDEEYRTALEKSELNVPDGMPLVWLLRWRGFRLRSRVYGPDLMMSICEEASRQEWSCFLYGSTPDVLMKLEQALERAYPGLRVVGHCAPPLGDSVLDADTATLDIINQANPDILWIALGGPKQDVWMARHSRLVKAGFMHGVGAAFDFLSGNKRQAPVWMRNAGLEWFFRLAAEPRRLFKRYTITNMKFVYYSLFR